MDGSRMKALMRSLVALGTVVGMLAFALPALANAPNPGTTTVDQVTVNSDGSRTVTVEGTWTWASQTSCSTQRNGVGYQVDWFDNTANAIGTNTSPDGVLYVGDAQDNIVHSIETLGGSSVIGNAFWDGVPSSYTPGTNPTATDAKNWLSECDGVNSSGVTAGNWGPITHTYAASFTGPITLCPIMYDPHGGHDNSGQSSVQDITAGANGSTKSYNNDNSYQTNDTGPGPGSCSTIKVPTLTTSASSGTSSIHDTATLTGSSGNGTITFNLYPAGSGCSGTPLFTSSAATTGDGDYQSGSDSSVSPGTYQWQASYASSTVKGLLTACNDSNEQSTVTKVQPGLVTSASSGTVGDSIQDAAILSGGSTPTGTITWKLYGPGDPSCSSTPLRTFTDSSINGDGTYNSPTYATSSAGTYRWVASYSGDGSNLSTSGSCNDPNEESTVTKASPALVTSATSTTLGSSAKIQDTATLSSGFSPTGTITWNLYGPGDSSCSSTPVATYTANVSGDGNYVSPSYSPTSAGTFRWIASYSGDGNNLSTAGSCNDTGEQSTVSKSVPTLTTNAVSGTAGGSIHDTATLTGGDSPSGSITWNLYNAATDTACATPLNNSTISVPVNGDGTYDSPDYPVSSAGTYEWVATYTGDGNNVAVATACGDPAEQSTVSNAPVPAIALTKLESIGSSGFVHGPLHGPVNGTVNYKMTVTDTGNTPLVIAFTDNQCDAGTLSGPVIKAGTFDSTNQTLSSGGELQYTCSHVLAAGDQPYTNQADVTGTSPSGQVVKAHDQVDAFADVPGIKVVKLERDASAGGTFTTGPINVSVGDTIDYEIQVTDTGNVPLTLSLNDPHCDGSTIAGPTSISGTLSGRTLSAGGVAQYTCSHVATAADIPQYTNTATVTGQPPSGPPVTGTGIVVSNITQAAIQVLKLERDATAGGSFTTGPITVTEKTGDYVVHTIDYEVQVTNTGNEQLTLSLDDPRCDAGTVQGPSVISGTLKGDVLSPGGEAQYTCSHALLQGDPSPFTNTATVTGTPPTGPSVSGHSSVTVNKRTVGAKTKLCRTPNGRIVHYKGKKKPAACRFHPKKPKKPSGFTG